MLSRRIMKRAFSKSSRLIDLEAKYGCSNYAPLPVVLERGQVREEINQLLRESTCGM